MNLDGFSLLLKFGKHTGFLAAVLIEQKPFDSYSFRTAIPPCHLTTGTPQKLDDIYMFISAL